MSGLEETTRRQALMERDGWSASSLAHEVALLNKAAGEARFYLGAPTHDILGNYTVRDRTLADRMTGTYVDRVLAGCPEGDVVADHYCLRDACADVDRRNARAATEADRASRPGRPLPSGIVVLCALIGLAIAGPADRPPGHRVDAVSLFSLANYALAASCVGLLVITCYGVWVRPRMPWKIQCARAVAIGTALAAVPGYLLAGLLGADAMGWAGVSGAALDATPFLSASSLTLALAYVLWREGRA